MVAPMPGVALAPRAFVFGKLPRHGDFVARGLEPEARAAWDDCLAGQMDAARDRLGADFAAMHGSAPPWRFCLGPGRFGSRWQAGCVAPSVDAAGRTFFIVVGGQTPQGLANSLAESVAQSLESLLYDALQSAWDTDTLLAAAQGVWDHCPVGTHPPPAAVMADRWWIGETAISIRQFPRSLIDPLAEDPVMQAGL